MTLVHALRAEAKRMLVSPVTLTAVILSLLIGAGIAAAIVGLASPYEDNYMMDAHQLSSLADDAGAATEAAKAEDGALTTGIVPGPAGEQLYVSSDYQVVCANESCTKIWREVPMDLDYLSTQAATSTTMLITVLAVGFALLLVGSDAGNGALTTQLTFTPNRRRLLAAKSLVASAGGMTLMVIGHVVSQSILLVGFIAQRSYQEVGAWPELVPGVARATLLAGILAMAAAFVVFLAGDARLAAAVTVGIVLVAYFTTPWVSSAPDSFDAPFLLLNPLVSYAAFLDPPVSIDFYAADRGYSSSIEVSFAQAFGIAIAWLFVLGALGYLRFTRRDIKD
ncbi:MAG TPA: ABC transporter permease subunit [Arachnia sp.]|nr:ABC transporter permease subunit [Arachnia sp.]HMT85842.1 ABC transporter permease subunit [Arachnia sp.]